MIELAASSNGSANKYSAPSATGKASNMQAEAPAQKAATRTARPEKPSEMVRLFIYLEANGFELLVKAR